VSVSDPPREPAAPLPSTANIINKKSDASRRSGRGERILARINSYPRG